jgi:DinB family protein
MSTTTDRTTTSTEVETRILREGYGPGAWHGADLKAALSDVTSAQAFKRPAPGRHNIAEIALHHAYCTRAVTAQLSGAAGDPFVLEGEDWFDLPDEKTLSWSKIQATVESEQSRLASTLAEIQAGTPSPISETERVNLVLGITCHAVYHAGQVQLIKKLTEA